MVAAMNLIEASRGQIAGIAGVFSEGFAWRDALNAAGYRRFISPYLHLCHIPMFKPGTTAGTWIAIDEKTPGTST